MSSDSYLVTGGEGFLGGRMVSMLKERYPQATITSMDLVQRHETHGHTFVAANLTDAADTLRAIQESKASVVFHVAAGLLEAKKSVLEKVNVNGTQNIIEACKKSGVKKLVYTSTAGVVFDGQDLINVDERLPPVEKDFHDPYMVTKARAEKLVLDANGKDGLLTCAIRPAGIFGPGDWFQGPQMIQIYKEGKTHYQLGKNNNLFEYTYVDNVVHAHLLAAEKLADIVPVEVFREPLDVPKSSSVQIRSVPTSHYRPNDSWDEGEQPAEPAQSEEIDIALLPNRNRYDQFYKPFALPKECAPAPVAGQAYFITNLEPIYFWDMPRSLWMEYAQHSPSSYWVFPKSVATILGSVVGFMNWMLGKPETFTKGKSVVVCASKYHNGEKARRMLGYEPIVGLEEGIKRSVAWYKTVENTPNFRQKGAKSKSQ